MIEQVGATMRAGSAGLEVSTTEGARAPGEGRGTRPPFILTVSDVRQYLYCPRIVFYRLCQPVKPPSTYKMEEGRLAQDRIEDLESRRSLKAYGMRDGERHFNVMLTSARAGLRGLLDMAIVREDEVIPVEYKNTSRKPPRGYVYQLAAYALLAEERWGLPARRGFVYMIPEKRAVAVSITDVLRSDVERVVMSIRRMVEREEQPGPTDCVARCIDCEYRRFCGDVD